MIADDEIIDYDENDRVSFRSGGLREEWATRYPQLFDEDDLRIARSQPDYHFFE